MYMLDTDTLTISAYSSAELAEVRALHALSFRKLAVGAHSAQQIHAHIKYMNTITYAEDLNRSNMICARDSDGEMIATAGWIWMDQAPTTARLRKIFVHPQAAVCGLGRSMVKRVEDLSHQHGATDHFVRANINAKGFYKRLGYQTIKPGTMEVSDGVQLPVVFMHKG